MKQSKFPQIVFAAILLMSLVAFSSCSKSEDDSPTPDPSPTTPVELPASVVTEYQGELVYTPTVGMPTINGNASATFQENGDSYTITFSDGVPSISNLKFVVSDGAYTSITDDGSFTGITIDDDELIVSAVQGGSTWAFHGAN